MQKFLNYIKNDPIAILLIVFPIAILANLFNWGSGWVFFLSAFGVVPMASYIGKGTEVLASKLGPRIGGLA